MSGVSEDSTLSKNEENLNSTSSQKNEEEVETETSFPEVPESVDLLADSADFHDEDYDPELEEDPEKIRCEECSGHGEYGDSICPSCGGHGYIIRNDLLMAMKQDVEINQQLLISIVSILHPLTKAFHNGSINKNDLARKEFMNAAAIANEVYQKVVLEKDEE